MVEIEYQPQHQHQNQCRDDLHCANDKQYQHCEKIIHILWPRWKAKSSLRSSSVQVDGREGKGVQCKRLLLEIHHRSISPLPEWFLFLIPFFLQLSYSCWRYCHYHWKWWSLQLMMIITMLRRLPERGVGEHKLERTTESKYQGLHFHFHLKE